MNRITQVNRDPKNVPKYTMKIKVLSLLLALCMIIGLLPVTTISAAAAASAKYYTVEKYDAEGNGTMLVPPTETTSWSGSYGTQFITSVLGSGNVTMSNDAVTGIKAADGTWLNNGGNSKWYIATNYQKEVYLDSGYFYASDVDVLRFIYVPNGDFSKAGMTTEEADYSDAFMLLDKSDLIKTLSAYKDVTLGANRQAAYDAGVAAIVNISATAEDVAAAKNEMENAKDAASSVELNEDRTELYVGQKETLTARVLPEGSTSALIWTSDHENVVTVEDGVLKGMSAGTATVTVKIAGTEFIDSIAVTVNELQELSITTVNPNASSTIEAKKEELLLTACAEPDNLENLDWQWSVEDPSIAEVIPTEGNEYLATVKGKAAGKTNVVVALGSMTSKFEVTVTPYVGPYVYFDYADESKEDQRLGENNTITLSSLDAGSFKIANANGAVRWNCAGNIPAPTADYPDAVAWHAWINSENGAWTPSGTQPVTASVDTSGGFTATFTINYQVASGITELKNVVNGEEVSTATPFSMDGTGRAGIVTKGLLNGEWITVPQQALKYTTSDTTGNIRILGNELILGMEGEATLTATMIGESVSASFRAQCGSVPLTGFTIKTPETFTITGEKNFMNNQYYGLELYSSNLVITYEPSNTTQTELVWEALTPNIAFYTVEHLAGIVPLRCGTAQFKVTSKSNSELTQTVTVKFLYQNPLERASLAKTAYTLEVGQNEALNFTFEPANATDKGFTYSYDKEGIVEIKNGKIYAQSVGNVTVTATPSDQTMDCQPVVFTVTVNRDSSIPYEDVTVKVGESKTYLDNTGDYTGASLAGLNTAVATVALEAETSAPVVIGNLGNDSSFNSATVDISKCLYNFAKSAEGTWTITGTDANGNTVYLYPGNGKDVANSDRTAGYPNAAADNPQLDGMTISITAGHEEGSFNIWSNKNAWQNEYGGYLYFNRMAYNWNRSQTISSDTDKSYCSLFLYRAAADGETSSQEIPGYVRVTSVDALTDGQYLIAAPGSNGNWYVAYPSASTASLYAQIARVSFSPAVSTKITITGVAAGQTSVTVNGVEYDITVVEANRTLTSDWPSFRGNDYNNGVTTYRTPRNAAETAQKWVNQISTGWSDTPSPMILVDGDLVTMSGSKLYKLNPATGATVASADMTAAPSYATTPPLFADNMIFCQLGGGNVQAFNADTLEPLWVYTDENGGQAQSPIAYSDGKLYVGFDYNDQGTGSCSFVCLNAEDGERVWRDVDGFGYYWSGAVVVGDYVIYGTNGGKVVSRNKETGNLVSALEVGSKVRSSICFTHGKVYFADYAANLCYADLNTATGVLSNLTKVDCSAYGTSSTSTPVVYNGIAYIGVGGWSGGNNIVAVNVSTNTIAWAIEEPAYPQCSILLSTAYEETDGYIYLYVTYNKLPGGVNVIKAKADGSEATQTTLYTPADDNQQYCICSVIADSDGTLYYKNDSGTIFALGKAENTADVAAAAKVIDSIKGIGTVTLDSETEITAARAAYNALTDDQKALVTNYSVLVAAEAALAHLKNPGTTPDPNPEDDKITVTFRLIGAEKATQDVDMGKSNYLPEYVTWIKTTSYTVDKGSVVDDVFTMALANAGLLDERTAGGNYVASITAPAVLGGDWLGEFDNGQYSGWMYTVNGKHPDQGLKNWPLYNGDVIIWHYVNDYRYEVEDWYGGSPNGTAETFNKWLKAPDVNPTSGDSTSTSTTKPSTSEGSTLAPSVTVTNGEAKAEVSEKNVSDAIASAKKDGAAAIVIAPTVKGDANKVTVELPKSAAQDIVSGTDAALNVQTAVGALNIPNDTLAEIVKAAGTANISMSVEKADGAAVKEKLPETAKVEGAVAVEFKITSGSKTISSFGGKSLEVSVPVSSKDHTNGKSYVAFIISEDGTVERTVAVIKNGAAVLTMRHFSTVVVTKEEVAAFTDVAAGEYYYDAVLWAVAKGITDGTSDTTFSPGADCTRAQMVTFLWRAAGSPEPSGKTNPFTDVDETAYYFKALLWAVENGITDGTSATTFSPDNTCTRGQMVAFLYRNAKKPPVSGSTSFTDVKSDSYFSSAVVWAANEGITSGTSATTFSPDATCTRGQMVTFLYRYLAD